MTKTKNHIDTLTAADCDRAYELAGNTIMQFGPSLNYWRCRKLQCLALYNRTLIYSKREYNKSNARDRKWWQVRLVRAHIDVCYYARRIVLEKEKVEQA